MSAHRPGSKVDNDAVHGIVMLELHETHRAAS